MHIHTLTLTYWAYILTRVCICMPHGSCVSGPTVCHSCLPFNIFPPCFTGFCFRFRAFLHVCSTCQPRQQISTINTCSTLCLYTCICTHTRTICVYTLLSRMTSAAFTLQFTQRFITTREKHYSYYALAEDSPVI